MISLEQLQENPELFGKILPEDQTEDHCLIAVKSSGHWLQYVKNQTPKIIEAALNENPFSLKYVINKTKEACLQAIKLNGLTLRYVTEQTEELCLIAVQENRAAIVFVKDQTPEICLEALSYGDSVTSLPHVNICDNKNFNETIVILTQMKQVRDNKKLVGSTIKNLKL